MAFLMAGLPAPLSVDSRPHVEGASSNWLLAGFSSQWPRDVIYSKRFVGAMYMELMKLRAKVFIAWVLGDTSLTAGDGRGTICKATRRMKSAIGM